MDRYFPNGLRHNPRGVRTRRHRKRASVRDQLLVQVAHKLGEPVVLWETAIEYTGIAHLHLANAAK